MKGFFKGTWQGLSGLVIKPVAGVFDAASKTAEGIKNTATHFDDKPNESREQQPRVFYGEEKFIQDYNEIDAQAVTTLQIFKKGMYANCAFLQAFIISDNPQDIKAGYLLILSKEAFILLSAKSQKRVWVIPTAQILNTSMHAEGIKISLREANKHIKVLFLIYLYLKLIFSYCQYI